MNAAGAYREGGAELLEELARDIVRIPPLSSWSNRTGGEAC